MSPRLHLLGLLFGLAAAATMLSEVATVSRVALEDAALDETTVPYFATRHGQPVHLNDVARLAELRPVVERITPRHTVLLLGNSQLHAINQYQPGQENAPAFLHDALVDLQTCLLTISLPNANLQEHLLCMQAFAAVVTQPDLMILPVVFDDTREDGLRPSLASLWQQHPETAAAVRKLSGGRVLSDRWSADAEPVRKSLTTQDVSEQYLNEALAGASDVWAKRGDLRGQLILQAYELRNSVFGITPNSIRRRIDSRYQNNLLALEAIVDQCQRWDGRLLVYLAPLRRDVPRPYDTAEYDEFKRTVQQHCRGRGGVRFVDLEDTVPAEHWGLKPSATMGAETEIDFMHFQQPGHRLLAERLSREAAAMLSAQQ